MFERTSCTHSFYCESAHRYSADHGETSVSSRTSEIGKRAPPPKRSMPTLTWSLHFAALYTYIDVKNSCDTQCNIASSVPICNNKNNQALVKSWTDAGKKVILCFRGAAWVLKLCCHVQVILNTLISLSLLFSLPLQKLYLVTASLTVAVLAPTSCRISHTSHLQPQERQQRRICI